MKWRKSSFSFSNSNCVEAATTGGLDWRTATASIGNGACVEVSGPCACGVAVRDSKDPDGPVLSFTPGEWGAFTDAIRAGKFAHL